MSCTPSNERAAADESTTRRAGVMDMATPRKREKLADVPPTGDRNPDPLTSAPGAHPIETGVGAALGGAAAGAAAGAVGGPAGAVAGAIVGGAVAGGLLGKGVGELIDPTTENEWLDDLYSRTK